MSASAEEYAQYNAAHEEVLKKVLSILDAPDWKEAKVEKDIKFYNRFESDSPYAMVKSIVHIPSTMDAVLKVISVIENVKDADGFKEREGFGQTGDDHQSMFLYVAVDSGSRLVTNRDFIMYRRHYSQDGKEIYLHQSINNDTIKPVNKSYVRGFMNFQGYIAEPEGDGVKLTFIVHADPKGSIPAMVYNAACTKQGYAAQKILKQVTGQ